MSAQDQSQQELKYLSCTSMVSKRHLFMAADTYRQELKFELERTKEGNKAREAVRHGSIEDILKEKILEAVEAFYQREYFKAQVKFSQVSAIAMEAVTWVNRFSSTHCIKEKHRRTSDVE